MTSILVDSDILIDVARGRDTRLLARWAELSATDAVIACSPVTVAEIWLGARTSEYKMIENLFRILTCVPIGPEIGKLAGDYLRQFSRSHAVELGDALIAATASVHRLSLWTRNRKHYPMKDFQLF